VREEFNRAEKLANDKRAGTVGFALTILQRRLASSPEAIYQSLRRRSERLQKRLRELELLQRGASVEAIGAVTPALDSDDLEDLDEAPDNEVEEVEEEILDQATAARSIGELKAEISTLGRLESLALAGRLQRPRPMVLINQPFECDQMPLLCPLQRNSDRSRRRERSASLM
jgi:hypothetical protein